MTDALSRVSRTSETGRKISRDNIRKGLKSAGSHREDQHDRVDISEEAREKGPHDKRRSIFEYISDFIKSL